MIERRGIPNSEKIYYLKRYVGGSAKECIESFFLLHSDDVFEKAKELLEERYGNSFVVAGAFRHKLESWSKIASRDGLGLRKFSDFLQIAMNNIDGLNVLNDCRENQKLLNKLPDWMISRWSRIVNDWKEKNCKFSLFKEFVKFVTKESTITCDPILSAINNILHPYTETSLVTLMKLAIMHLHQMKLYQRVLHQFLIRM